MALLHSTYFSNVLGITCSADVIIPDGYNPSAASGGLRTIYLLHGMSDDHTMWQRQTSIERYANANCIAVIMPSTQLGWYTDMECGYQKYFSYISKELPQICHRLFPQLSSKREDNYVAGLSMGGYGSMKMALAESESFCKAACFSGAYFIDEKNDSPYWVSIFGTGDQRKKHEIPTYVDALIAENRKKPDFYIWCGTDDSLLDQNRTIRDYLIKKGFDVTYAESPGGHEWKCWDEQIAIAIRFFNGEKI